MSAHTITKDMAASIRTIGGDILYHTAVVVGSVAIYLAFPNSARQPHDIDLSVPPDMYERLRALPGWRICETTYRTKNILRSQQFDIGIGWGGMDHTALFKRSWQTLDGLHIANLSTIYSWKRARTASKDKRDTVIIRKNLHDLKPLPFDTMRYEIAHITSCLPTSLRRHPDCGWIIRLATHGLLATFSRNHQPHLFHSRTSIDTLLLFNQAADPITILTDRLRKVLAHREMAIVATEEQFIAIVALLYSDLLYDPQQQISIPFASIATQHALVYGYTPHHATRIGRIIDEITRQKNTVDPLSKVIMTACRTFLL